MKVDIRNPGKLLVTDEFNNALRSVDLETGELSTVTKSNLKNLRGLLWANQELLVANMAGYTYLR